MRGTLHSLLICLIGMTAVFCSGKVLAEDYGSTARGIFTMLPTSIFESTAEGLSEGEKQELLATGACEFWEIAGETQDVLVFASLPFRERFIGMRIFRDNVNGGTTVAIGTVGEPVCALELWHMDSSGRLVPIDGPDEPDASEFFARGRKVSRKLNPSVLVCLGKGGLFASPVFWDKTGRLMPKMDNEITFQWNGENFVKEIHPLGKMANDVSR